MLHLLDEQLNSWGNKKVREGNALLDLDAIESLGVARTLSSSSQFKALEL